MLFIILTNRKNRKYIFFIFSTVNFGRNYYQNFMYYIYIKFLYKLLKIIMIMIIININRY